jgi:carbamoyltransferase
MIMLGVHEGHDAGAAVLRDGHILSAVNEERLARKKLYLGVPKLAVEECMRLAKVSTEDIDAVAVAGTLGVMASLGWEKLSPKKKFYQFISNHTPFPKKQYFIPLQRSLFRPLRNRLVAQHVRSIGIDAPLSYVDHHKCHAASAYYTSGKKNCLVVTSDGSGDAVSSSVYAGRDNMLELVREFPTFHSVAYYYGYITQIAGFKMFKHEGKITGLAAHGDSQKAYPVFEQCFGVQSGNPVNRLGLIGEGSIRYLQEQLDGVSMEDYSAGIQKRTEDVASKYVDYYVKRQRLQDVAVAGGLFANVKVNQRILELDGVDSLFIHPHMGDGGLAVGAALSVTADEMAATGSGLRPYILNNTYFGPGYSNEEIGQAIDENKLKGEFVTDIEDYIAEKVAGKKIVGHFDGRMEYGPRALGNRSILADPTDKTINDWLNKRLKRTEFMPFAPSILDCAASSYYNNYEPGDYPARFMTITFDDTKEAQKAQAVVHVDNTTRPQVVSQKNNARYYRILQKYEEKTGLPIFVNTSFNIHEEPIVCSPQDAIRSHLKGTTDILVMGNWVIE